MSETLHVTEYSSGGKTELTINEGYSPYDNEWWALKGAGSINLSKDELDALCLWWLAKHPELVKPSLTEEERKALVMAEMWSKLMDDGDTGNTMRSLLERTK